MGRAQGLTGWTIDAWPEAHRASHLLDGTILMYWWPPHPTQPVAVTIPPTPSLTVKAVFPHSPDMDQTVYMCGLGFHV